MNPYPKTMKIKMNRISNELFPVNHKQEQLEMIFVKKYIHLKWRLRDADFRMMMMVLVKRQSLNNDSWQVRLGSSLFLGNL